MSAMATSAPMMEPKRGILGRRTPDSPRKVRRSDIKVSRSPIVPYRTNACNLLSRGPGSFYRSQRPPGRERPRDACALAQTTGRAHGTETQSTIADQLLAGLPPRALAKLRRHLESVSLPGRQVLAKPGAQIDHVYFPESGMVSLVHALADGTQIEVGVVGREGFVGVAVLNGADTSPIEAMVQTPGSALRMSATVFRAQVARSKPISDAAHRYAQALHVQVSETAACNGRHVLQERLARWLLAARDRAESNELPLSREFLSMMLGARRSRLRRFASRLPFLYASEKNIAWRRGVRMSWMDDFVGWLKNERGQLQGQLVALQSGSMRITKRQSGSTWVDTTQDEIERLRRTLADIDRLIAHHQD
jgi:CRP-like cAMP-binding protein